MSEPLSIPQILKEWLEWALNMNSDSPGQFEFLWTVENEPEVGWLAILAAINDSRLKPTLGMVAAGPLEDLLCYHGPKFINRIESEAKINPTLAWMLGDIYQGTITNEIWNRIQVVANHND